MRKRMGCYGGWLTTKGSRKSGRRKALTRPSLKGNTPQVLRSLSVQPDNLVIGVDVGRGESIGVATFVVCTEDQRYRLVGMVQGPAWEPDHLTAWEPYHQPKQRAYHLIGRQSNTMTRTRVSGPQAPYSMKPLRRVPGTGMPLYRRPIKSPRKWFPRGSWCHGDRAFLYNRKGTMKMTTKHEIHLFATNNR